MISLDVPGKKCIFRTMFHELRLALEHLAYSNKCPGIAKTLIYKVQMELKGRPPVQASILFRIFSLYRNMFIVRNSYIYIYIKREISAANNL